MQTVCSQMLIDTLRRVLQKSFFCDSLHKNDIMRRLLFLSLLLLNTGILIQAQTLKKTLELKMPKTEDDEMGGTRGASVVWHPEQKKFYAAFAGNEGYPLGVFDAKGKILNANLTTMVDTRGLWFDPATKTIAGNGYGETGWFTYKLDKQGFPLDYTITLEGMNQPSEQSLGTYNPLTKLVMFHLEGFVYMADNKGDLKDSAFIHFRTTNAEDIDEDEDYFASEEYNPSMVYTGIKGQELGFLNFVENQIELYDIKSGLLKKTLQLPDDAPVEDSFNFAYANGIYWLFDIEERTWKGYK